MKYLIGAALTVVLALGAGWATAAATVDGDEDRAAAAGDRRNREADRDAVRDDVQRSLDLLEGQRENLGQSAVPVRDEPVDPPKGVDENILTGDLVIGDFHDVFIDEGIVLTGVSAEEVDSLPRQPRDTYPPKPQPPLEPEEGYRLLRVELLVTNRSGVGADPGCGFASGFGGGAIMDSGERALVLDAYQAVGTYQGACGEGLADGVSGRIVLPVGLREGDELAALEVAFLGDDDSDGRTQVLVFEDPV